MFWIAALSVGAWAAAAPAQETAPDAAKREGRVRVLVNGAYSPTGLTFSEPSTFTSFVEEGRSNRDYDGGKGVVFEGGAIVSVFKELGVMGSVEIYRSDFDGAFEESLPHPLYFNEPRLVGGDLPGLDYEESALHIDAVYTRVIRSWTVDFFGGPTFFFTNTEVLDRVDITSSYPFDEAQVSGTTKVKLDDDPIGFNAGGAVTYQLTDVVGIAVQGRFSRGSITIQREGGEGIDLDAGGFRIGAGIRLRF